jgi:hypothetical protein
MNPTLDDLMRNPGFAAYEGPIRMRFWIAGNWEGRVAFDVDSDNIEPTAERIWNFLNPSEPAGPMTDMPRFE